MTLLERYIGGQYKQVWKEMLAGGLSEDAEAVADETMRRTRRNIQRIIGRLRSVNYRFQDPKEILVSPGFFQPWRIKRLEKLAGPVPLSIRRFYGIVGTVNLNGNHDSWSPKDHPDPLMINTPIGYFLRYAYKEWKENNESLAPKERDKFQMELAPDFYHKADVSGGAPYSIELPNGAADAPFLREPHKTTFVDYLRIAFKWGGFPGFSRSKKPPRKFISMLTDGLEPI